MDKRNKQICRDKHKPTQRQERRAKDKRKIIIARA